MAVADRKPVGIVRPRRADEHDARLGVGRVGRDRVRRAGPGRREPEPAHPHRAGQAVAQKLGLRRRWGRG